LRNVLHDIILVALENRASRVRRGDYTIFIDGELLGATLAFGLLAPLLGLVARLGLLFHPARLQLRATLQALQPGKLLAQPFVLRTQLGNLLAQLLHQDPEIFKAQSFNIAGRIGYAPSSHRFSPLGIPQVQKTARGFAPVTTSISIGHESIETTQTYLHAHLALKEAALVKLKPLPRGKAARFRPNDRLLEFLNAL
jgi:hypothetical protein